ncbi:hypothetical protein [Marinobacter sp. CHS3-4]|uniref:hypothetical protein n=1 Tax=Marinobacter sp. CHS3-4 TaxID=3045174 RepID=UPI0024B58B70|nr:hypothetical protein [Marinobacter sp. CHS3-4]MDI9243635.1 hypothetical protein [Marinobacter sp. CHS3-4]
MWRSVFYCVVRIVALAGIIAPIAHASEPPEPEKDWVEVVRNSPYWVSQGVYQNITTIRRWVLKERGFCSVADRHILFDRRGQFLGYIDDAATRQATQIRLNETRAALAEKGKVDSWVPGSLSDTGYPFALSCLQPHVDLSAAVDRYLGRSESDLLWGTWDDLIFASQAEPRSLHQAMMYVYQTRLDQQRLDLPATLPRYLGGQVLIESSGQANAHSRADAKGILQLSPSALNDCQIKPVNHWHRLAQVDCALKLMQQNARNLEPTFEERFGHLPDMKRDQLFTLLLVQAYHGGVGRVLSLLTDEQLSKPAIYFAREHEEYSAGDILFGMIFHNLGRDRLGLASLYYVADVELATEALCATVDLRQEHFCP